MTKAEVVFEGNTISINGIDIDVDTLGSCAIREYFDTIEQAIKYCLENKHESD